MVAEPSPTLTGARSLDRLPAEAGRIPLLVAGLARVFGVASAAPALRPAEQAWIERAGTLLAAGRGKGLVLVGAGQPAETQALGWAIDERLGNLGATSRFTRPLRPSPTADQSLDVLLSDMRAGQVQTLAILQANPVYTSPLGRSFARALARVEFSVHAGLWHDETSQACGWHAPLAHALESWSDGRAADGSAVIGQPLVRPFYDVRPPPAMLAAITGTFDASDHDLVQQTWSAAWGELQPDWDTALVKGLVRETPAESVVPPGVKFPSGPLPPYADDLELLIRPDPTVWDGRLANNPWAQEAPKPLTTLTWDNAVLIAPALAAQLGLEDGDEVRLARGGAAVTGAVWVMPGQAPRTVLIHRGYGRGFGAVARGAGFDAAPLIGRDGPVTLTPTGDRRELAAAQEQHAIESGDRPPVRTVDVLDTAPPQPRETAPSFWEDKPRSRPSWGMSIDLDLCTGCGACVTACIAENNIPMVGREAVRNGRRMHWLRIDRYYEGSPERPALHSQPVPCMHCEDAPCEMGCPVNASVHSPEGLNLQVYNRCIGTRTCSSYCPYKVRRFNWDDYSGGTYGDELGESLKAQRNPNVTVRARGVMEKCTYCIQRISTARIDAKIAGQPIADGAVRTACQQVCPTGAISFGDIADPKAEVVKRKTGPRDYTLLEEANTRPRTSYRARIRSERGDG
jgi:molybdopterin-containing oxidoreductase family iron-sulfur binding subunit